MSEAPFPGDEAPAVDAVEEESTGPDRRILVGGGVAALVLIAGGFFFLTGGEEEELPPVTRAPRAAAAAPAPTATPARLAPVSTEQLGRDPFKPLFVASAAAPVIDLGTAGGTTAGGTTTGGTSTGGTTTGGTTTGGSVSSPAPAATKAPSATADTIKFASVAQQNGSAKGSFLVDGKQTVTAAAGDVIGETVAITALGKDGGGWFATMKVGDGSPFQVRVGQTVVLPN